MGCCADELERMEMSSCSRLAGHVREDGVFGHWLVIVPTRLPSPPFSSSTIECCEDKSESLTFFGEGSPFNMRWALPIFILIESVKPGLAYMNWTSALRIADDMSIQPFSHLLRLPSHTL